MVPEHYFNMRYNRELLSDVLVAARNSLSHISHMREGEQVMVMTG